MPDGRWNGGRKGFEHPNMSQNDGEFAGLSEDELRNMTKAQVAKIKEMKKAGAAADELNAAKARLKEIKKAQDDAKTGNVKVRPKQEALSEEVVQATQVYISTTNMDCKFSIS